MFFRDVTKGAASRMAIVDHEESYGRHILEKAIVGLNIKDCLDLGCGEGNDLEIVKKYNPSAQLFGIDYGKWNFNTLQQKKIIPLAINIENERLPFDNDTFDLIIANQFFEHTKEIFWINHEVFRCLKKGGHLFIGVPNILSLHNRILMMAGHHPTQYKSISAHVRPFSKKDIINFYQTLGKDFCNLKNFWGSQFYPFPKKTARIFSSILPSLSFSIFFLIEKNGDYDSSFIKWPVEVKLETNFFTGLK